jgi:hypothetical protein
VGHAGGAADSKYYNELWCFNVETHMWQFAHTFHKPPACAYQTTLVVQVQSLCASELMAPSP